MHHREQHINLEGESLMPELLESIRSSARNLDHMSILQEETSVLLGVFQAAARALDGVNLVVQKLRDLRCISTWRADAVRVCDVPGQ